jgi:hypothetical protein
MFWYIGYLPFVSLDAEPTFLSQDRRRSLLRTKTGDGRSRSSPASPSHRNDDRSLPGMSDLIERERLLMIWLSFLSRKLIKISPGTDASIICFSRCLSSPLVAATRKVCLNLILTNEKYHRFISILLLVIRLGLSDATTFLMSKDNIYRL